MKYELYDYKKRAKRDGYVYFISDGTYVKIGFSDNPEKTNSGYANIKC